jgi:hypothetical protein
MPTTFLLALKNRYETVVDAGWPAFWSGIQPEGSARVFPNHLCVHMGDRPLKFQKAADGSVVTALRTGRAKMSFFAVGEESANDLAQTLHELMESSALEVDGDTTVWLFQEEYRLNNTRSRGPTGQFVFEAATTYAANWNPVQE